MISAMIKGWGRGVAGALLVAVSVTGCGGAADAKPNKAPAPQKAVKPVKTQWDDTMEWWASHDIGCLNGSRVEADEEGCAIRVQDYVGDVRKIRKAMNTDAAAPKGFYTDAYVIIDRLEKYAGTALGKDDTQGWLDARPLIWMEGQALTKWIEAHPLQ
ncbi:hypothetical protein [Streptomyces rimosus]|uniref:hypothetical protein n=1 Tax=Streptomyces rimosus TaxID=1927 RepID=UPI0004C262D7|nr:hypothetical protein [Streptomyces rimosus]